MARSRSPGTVIVRCAALFLSLISAGSSGAVTVPETLPSSPFVLDKDNSPWVVGNYAVVVNAGQELVIEPGVAVEFSKGGAIIISGGTLTALGTADERIGFTSNQVDKAPGQWRGLWFEGAATCTLEYCDLEYGAYGPFADLPGRGSVRGMVNIIQNASLTMRNCSVRYGYWRGLWFNGGGSSTSRIIVEDCEFVENGQGQNVAFSDGAIFVGDSGNAEVQLRRNLIEKTGVAAARKAGIRLWGVLDPTKIVVENNTFRFNDEGIDGELRSIARATHGGNVYLDNNLDGVRVINQYGHWTKLEEGGFLGSDDGPYRFEGEDSFVSAGGSLVVAKGAQLEFVYTLVVENGGHLEARGEVGSEVVLTSDDAAKGTGQWRGLILNGGSAVLEHCVVECGGSNSSYPGNVFVASGAKLQMSDCVVREAGWDGIHIRGALLSAGDVVVERTAIDGVTRSGVRVQDTTQSSCVVLRGNTITESNSGVSLYSPATLSGNTFSGNVGGGVVGYLSTLARSVIGTPTNNTYSGNGFDGLEVQGIYNNPTDDLTTNGLLMKDGGPYRFTMADSYVSGEGALTIQPGVELQMAGVGMTVKAGGTLIAKGESGREVVFTGAGDSKAAGQWSCLLIEPGASGEFSFCNMEYGGASGTVGMLTILQGGAVSLRNCLLRQSADSAIYFRTSGGSGTGSLVVEECTFSDVSLSPSWGYRPALQIGNQEGGTAPVTIRGNVVQRTGTAGSRRPGLMISGAMTAGDVLVESNTFEDNSTAIWLWNWNNDPAARISGNTFRNHVGEPISGEINSIARSVVGSPMRNNYSGITSGIPGIVLDGGTLSTGEGALRPDGVAPGQGYYHVKNKVTVGGLSTLTIADGVEMRFSGGMVDLEVGGQAKFYAVGTAGKGIKFTTAAATPAPGGWGSLIIHEKVKGLLEHCTVEYGSYNYAGQIMLDSGCDVALRDCVIRKSAKRGLWVRHTSVASPPPIIVERCTISHNVQTYSGVLGSVTIGTWGTGLPSPNVIFRDNLLERSGPSPSRKWGMEIQGTLDPAKVLVKGNTFTDCSEAIRFYEQPAGASIVCNSFTDNGIAVVVNGPQNGSVLSTNVFGTEAGPDNATNLYNMSVSGVFPAAHNYWGSTTPTKTALRIQGAVDFLPIHTSLPPAVLADGTFMDPDSLGTDGKVHATEAGFTVAMDRIVDAGLTVVETVRISPAPEATYPTSGAFQSDGRTWVGGAAGLANGVYQVRIKNATSCFGDAAGQDLTALQFEVYIKYPPEPPQNLAASTDNVNVTLTWEPSPSEDVVEQWVRRTGPDGGVLLEPIAKLTPATVTFTEDPTEDLPDNLAYEITAVDSVGQESIPASVSVTLDNTPPVVVIALGQPKYQALYVTSKTPLMFTATDPAGVVEFTYDFDGGSFLDVPESGEAFFEGLADGAHTVTAIATDALGNTCDPFSRTLQLDNTAPDVAVDETASGIFVSGDDRFIKGGRTLVIKAQDGGVGVESITVSGNVYSGDKAEVPVSNQAGVQTFTYLAADRLGNVAAEKSITLNVITEAPTSTVVAEIGKTFERDGRTYVRADTRLTMSAVSPAVPGGIGKLVWKYRNWGGTIGPYQALNVESTEFYVPSGLVESHFELLHYAVDKVGNQEEQKATPFTLDRSAPVNPGVEPVNEVFWDGTANYAVPPFEFRIPVAEKPDDPSIASGLKEIYYRVQRIDGSQVFETNTYTDPTSLRTFTPPETPCAITIVCYALDNLDQKSQVKTHEVVLDPNPRRLNVVLDPASETHVRNDLTYMSGAVGVRVLSGKIGTGGTEEVDTEYRIERVDAAGEPLSPRQYVYPADGSFQAAKTPLALPAPGSNGGLEANQHNALVFRPAGDSQAEQSMRFYADTQGPGVALAVADPARTHSSDGTTYVAGAAQFVITPADAGSGLKEASGLFLSKDGGVTYSAASTTFSLGGPDRDVSLIAKAVDNVGNSGISSPAQDYRVDSTAPVTSLLPGPHQVSGGKRYAETPWTFEIQPLDAESGVAEGSTIVKDNNVVIVPAEHGSFTIEGEGSRYLSYSSRDNVQYQEETKGFSITLLAGLPDPPRNVSASAASSESVLVTWVPPVDTTGVKSYHLYRLVDDVEVPLVSVAATAPKQYVVQGLTPTEEVTFVMRTEDTLGQMSARSNPASATPTALPPTINQPDDGDVISSLNVAVAGKAEPGASIIMTVGAGGEERILGEADAFGSFNLTAAFSGEGSFELHFYARVYSAEVGYVTSTPSVIRRISVDIKPSTPTGLAVQELDTRVRLSWTANPESDIVGYNVYRDGNLEPLKSITATGLLSMEDLALTNGRKYSYRVQAIDARGNKSALSAPVEAIPAAGVEWGL